MSVKARKAESGLWAVDIDGATYEWERWGAEEALDTLTEILDLLGKPLGGLIDMLQAKRETTAAPTRAGVGGKIVSGLMRKLKRNKEDVKLVLKRLTSGPRVFCDGKAINFNRHYENELALMFKVANAAVEVQYGNFLDAVLDALGHDPAAARASLSTLTNKSEQTSGSASSPATAA